MKIAIEEKLRHKPSKNLLQYLEGFDDSTRVSVICSCLNAIGDVIDLSTIESASREEIIEALKRSKLKSCRRIESVLSELNVYATSTGNSKFAETLQIDADTIKDIWLHIKDHNGVDQKYISYQEYLDLIEDIKNNERFNSEYYIALIRAIYDGIFGSNENESLKNLRESDIHNNIVTVKPNNEESFKLAIHPDTAVELKRCSHKEKWLSSNRHGTITETDMISIYPDAVFKVIKKPHNNLETMDSFGRMLRVKLKYITEEYLGRTLTISQLYLSGLMYRIERTLHVNGYTLDDAFGENRTRRVLISKIISDECERSGSITSKNSLRKAVRYDYKIFEPNE